MSANPNKKIYVLFTCLDWRLHPKIEQYFTRNGDGCDCCVTAGSIQGLLDDATQNLFLKQIEISKNLHHCAGVILTMHLDCGAYGGSKNFVTEAAETAHHAAELERATTVISGRSPGLAVERYIVGLRRDGAGWAIEPKRIA